MFSLEQARQAVADGAQHVELDSRGAAVSLYEGSGHFTAVVKEVSDALKKVSSSGLITGSVDRDEVWEIDRLVLSAEVVSDLDAKYETLAHLLEAVDGAGYTLEIR